MRVLAWPAFRKEAANPHAALLARELIRLGVAVEDWRPVTALLRPGDVWHLHHPETVLFRRSPLGAWGETAVFLVLLALARLRGVRVLWTIHDLGSNDRLHPRLEALFWRVFVPAVDRAVCLSDDARRAALAAFPRLATIPVDVLPHGHYADAYPGGMTRAEARARLDLDPDAPVILHFGLLRPYKNAPHLIRTFRAAAIPGAGLVVAGRPFDAAAEREVRAAAEGAGDVRLDLRWIAPDEVQVFFAAADLVALPYRRITNSGAVFLALTFGRPVLVPDLGSMREHRGTLGEAWVRLFDGDLSPEDLTGAVAWARETERPPPDLGALGWDEVARATKDIYGALAAGSVLPRHATGPA